MRSPPRAPGPDQPNVGCSGPPWPWPSIEASRRASTVHCGLLPASYPTSLPLLEELTLTANAGSGLGASGVHWVSNPCLIRLGLGDLAGEHSEPTSNPHAPSAPARGLGTPPLSGMLTCKSSSHLPRGNLVAALLPAFLWLARCARHRWEAPLPAVFKGFSPAPASVWYLVLLGPATLLCPALVWGQAMIGRVKEFEETAPNSTLLTNDYSPQSPPTSSSSEIHVFYHIFQGEGMDARAKAKEIV